jgi:hypothetical protein
MTRFIYVDNSNLWIEGQRVAAVKSNLCPTICEVLDNSWKIDFGALYRLTCPPGEDIGRVALFGSRPPPNDSLWKVAEDRGFEVQVFDRNVANKEKKVDASITTMMLEDSYEYMKEDDLIVLVSGDGDFVPPVASLRERGFRVRNMFWAHGSRELRDATEDFFELDRHFGHLSLY